MGWSYLQAAVYFQLKSKNKRYIHIINGNNKQQRYESIVNDFYQDIYRYAFWLSKSQHMAEDLVQETFLRAWRSLDSLKNDSSVKAWLFTILNRENVRPYAKYRPELVDIEDQSISDTSDNEPETEMEREILHNAITKLDSNYREPLLLQVIGGFNSKEIAGILDLNSNTVLTRLFRARAKLLHEFAQNTDEINESNGIDKLTAKSEKMSGIPIYNAPAHC